MDNNDCCGQKSCCEQKDQKSNPDSSKIIKPKTTCCACENCTCGEDCLCPGGKFGCDPCQEFVDSKKKHE